ncbi:hypothetical protein WJX79_005120 [Trebouxia sp. C0005]
MDGIALSWILRIQELQLVLANTQRELQAQRTRQHEAQALLGQTLQDQDKVQQAALEVQLQKAKLHFAIFKLETKGSNKPTDHTLSSNSIACEQSKLDQVITKKQRIAAKMKQEQKESQEFSKLMKGLQMDKEQSLADLQLKLSEQKRQTELVRQKAASLRQSLNESQEETSAKEKLLNQAMIEERQGEHRLHQEQAISKALRNRQQQLRSQLEKHTVVCLELPGCGRSDSVKQPLTHQQYADWIVQFLHYMDITKAVVIGHSCSTAPAIALAESHSSLVSHLILVSAIGGHAPRGLAKIVFGRLREAANVQRAYSAFSTEICNKD